MTNEKKNNPIATLLTVVLLVVVSSATGYLAAKNSLPTVPSPGELLEAKATPEGGTTFYNKVIKAISQSAEGEVVAVSGDSVTLKEKEDSLTFQVISGAKVIKIVMPKAVAQPESTNSAQSAPKPPTTEEITLSQIRSGERVSALLSLTADGLRAYSLTVFVQEK